MASLRIGAIQYIQRLTVLFGKTHHHHERGLVAEEGKVRPQEHPTLQIPDLKHEGVEQHIEDDIQITYSSAFLEWREQSDDRRSLSKTARMTASVEMIGTDFQWAL